MTINLSIAIFGLYLTSTSINLLQLIPKIDISTQVAAIRSLHKKRKKSKNASAKFLGMEDFPEDDDNNINNDDDDDFFDDEEAGRDGHDIYYESEDDENFVRSRRFRARL